MALTRLGVRLRAERAKLLRGPAVGDDALDARNRRPDRVDLSLGLPTTPDDAEALGAGPRQMLGGDTARGAGAPLPERVGFDHGDQRAGLRSKRQTTNTALPATAV